MAKPKTNEDGYRRVLLVITKSRLARSLCLTRQAVGNWGAEVPESYAYRTSIITGIPLDEILPEVAPEVHRRLKELANAEAKG